MFFSAKLFKQSPKSQLGLKITSQISSQVELLVSWSTSLDCQSMFSVFNSRKSFFVSKKIVHCKNFEQNNKSSFFLSATAFCDAASRQKFCSAYFRAFAARALEADWLQRGSLGRRPAARAAQKWADGRGEVRRRYHVIPLISTKNSKIKSASQWVRACESVCGKYVCECERVRAWGWARGPKLFRGRSVACLRSPTSPPPPTSSSLPLLTSARHVVQR